MRHIALKSLTLAAVTLAAGLSQAQAQPCATNFKSSGVPMISTITYRTWDLIPNRKPAAVLGPLARAVAADGFDNVQTRPAG
jgi:hypothetical protein